jgi:hypothetical protein
VTSNYFHFERRKREYSNINFPFLGSKYENWYQDVVGTVMWLPVTLYSSHFSFFNQYA